MGYAIFRAEKRQHRSAVAMIRHALRESKVPNAVDGGRPPEVLAGATTGAEAREQLASLVATAKAGGQRWRKDQVEVVDLLITTSRIDMQTWDLARQRSYFDQALEWIRARWPHAKVLTAAVHRDESTAHMQVLLAPTDSQGRFRAKEMLGGPSEMSQLQDSFWERVGAKYELYRGEKRSKAKHVPVRQFYATMEDGIEPPSYKPVPQVPPPPSLLDKITGKAAAIESVRRKAAKQKIQALEHNKRERDRLNEQAKKGRSIHPIILERQAEKYRAAMRAEDLAKKAVAEAQKQRQRAQNDLAQAQAALDQARAAEASVEDRIHEIVLADAKTIDRFSRHWSKEYVGRLATDVGVPLVTGKPILDQLRRAGLATDAVDAAKKLDQWDRNILDESHRWQEQEQAREIHRPHRPKGG